MNFAAPHDPKGTPIKVLLWFDFSPPPPFSRGGRIRCVFRLVSFVSPLAKTFRWD